MFLCDGVVHLYLLTQSSTCSVLLQLLFNQPQTHPKSQKNSSVSGSTTSNHSPESPGLELGGQPAERQAEEAVPSGQEGLRLDGAGRAGHTQPLIAELRWHTAGWFEEPRWRSDHLRACFTDILSRVKN